MVTDTTMLASLVGFGLAALPPLPALRGEVLYSVVCVSVFTLAMLFVVAMVQGKSRPRRVGLVIQNDSNVACSYELRAESPEPHLAFGFSVGGVDLTPEPEPELEPVAAVEAAQPQYQPAAPPARKPSGGAMSTARGAVGIGVAIADVLSAVAYIAPASVRSGLMGTINSLRSSNYTAQRALDVPGRLGNVGRAAGAAPRQAAQAAPPPAMPAPVPAARPRVRSRAARASAQGWAVTSPVEPGQSLALDLFVRREGAVSSGQPAISVLSRVSGLPNAPVVVERGNISLVTRSLGWRLGPYFIVLAMAVVLLALVFWLASVGLLSQ